MFKLFENSWKFWKFWKIRKFWKFGKFRKVRNLSSKSEHEIVSKSWHNWTHRLYYSYSKRKAQIWKSIFTNLKNRPAFQKRHFQNYPHFRFSHFSNFPTCTNERRTQSWNQQNTTTSQSSVTQTTPTHSFGTAPASRHPPSC